MSVSNVQIIQALDPLAWTFQIPSAQWMKKVEKHLLSSLIRSSTTLCSNHSCHSQQLQNGISSQGWSCNWVWIVFYLWETIPSTNIARQYALSPIFVLGQLWNCGAHSPVGYEQRANQPVAPAHLVNCWWSIGFYFEVLQWCYECLVLCHSTIDPCTYYIACLWVPSLHDLYWCLVMWISSSRRIKSQCCTRKASWIMKYTFVHCGNGLWIFLKTRYLLLILCGMPNAYISITALGLSTSSTSPGLLTVSWWDIQVSFVSVL